MIYIYIYYIVICCNCCTLFATVGYVLCLQNKHDLGHSLRTGGIVAWALLMPDLGEIPRVTRAWMNRIRWMVGWDVWKKPGWELEVRQRREMMEMGSLEDSHFTMQWMQMSDIRCPTYHVPLRVHSSEPTKSWSTLAWNLVRTKNEADSETFRRPCGQNVLFHFLHQDSLRSWFCHRLQKLLWTTRAVRPYLIYKTCPFFKLLGGS